MAKVNVYISDGLLERVDADALSLGRSRSSVVQEALATYVATRAESVRRSGAENAIAIADRVAHEWPENDMLPAVGATEFLIGLRHASEQDDDDDIVRSILEQRARD
ncbi:MAG: ribbon-helix-helix protein, CopG family [Actinomycetota bacterium]|nr:MAG: hypothetical protein FD171_2242 [Actinomycetota bacterium]MDO8950889.1 ribbon-helix-helix protein, CopG family [Actinomycetota bacterium]MDP3630140.1 ribbon-helix-helix protein, CopG family [Actinomycetota bacterium]